MNKLSMDALNAGWNVGFGTQVPSQNRDFDLLVAQKTAEQSEPELKHVDFVEAFVAEVQGKVEAILAVLARRPAH